MNDYMLTLSETEVARYRFMAQAAAERERDRWTAAGVVPGAQVADIGCGPGAMSCVLAAAVGPTGTVSAVDRDPQALELARSSAREAGVSNVSFREGSAAATGLPAQSVDVAMLRHVLAHNGGQEQHIVDHLATLVRPGGAVYLVDVDATAIRLHPSASTAVLAGLGERYHQFHTRLGNDLSVGLRLADLLMLAGLEQVDHRGDYQIVRSQAGMRPPSWAAREQMQATGIIDSDDIARWESEFQRLDSGQTSLTMFVPVFVAVGRKPA